MAFAAALARKQAALQTNLLRAVDESTRDALQEAVRQSSGGLSYAAQRALYRQNGGRGPYSRAAPMNPPNPAVINKNQGDFAAGWTADQARVSMGGVVSRVYNTSKLSQYMTGTRLMTNRDPRGAIVTAVLPRHLRRVERAVRDALSK